MLCSIKVNVMGPSLCSLIKGLWNKPYGIRVLNKTLVCLIPKEEDASQLNQFRPISLCNVSYTAFAKVLATKLRLVMDKIESNSM